MPDHNGAGRKTTRLFNWLEWLDKKAPTLPRAMSWLEPYGSFMLARYPNLRPEPIPGNPRSLGWCESSERTAAEVFGNWESRIAASQEAAICTDGLDGERRKQLAALLVDIVSELEMRTAKDRSSQWKRQLCKEAPTRIRMLNRKLHNARQAVQKLMDYAEASGIADAPDSALYRARRMLGQPYIVAASNALQDLGEKHLPDAQMHIEIAGESLDVGKDDVEVFGMVRLYWFFRHACNLAGDEAEVRVARIRNAFWNDYGIENVSYRAEYITGQSKGCEAVHVAVRGRPNKGYKPNENPA